MTETARTRLLDHLIAEGKEDRRRLSAEELESLNKIAEGLAKNRIPQDHETALIKNGLAKPMASGLDITMRGRFAIR